MSNVLAAFAKKVKMAPVEEPASQMQEPAAKVTEPLPEVQRKSNPPVHIPGCGHFSMWWDGSGCIRCRQKGARPMPWDKLIGKLVLAYHEIGKLVDMKGTLPPQAQTCIERLQVVFGGELFTDVRKSHEKFVGFLKGLDDGAHHENDQGSLREHSDDVRKVRTVGSTEGQPGRGS